MALFPAPRQTTNLVNMDYLLAAFQEGTAPVEDLVMNTFANDLDLGFGVLAYLDRYGLTSSPQDYATIPGKKAYKDRRSDESAYCGSVQNNPPGKSTDPYYPYRVVLTAAVIAGTARDNADGKYAILFDHLWDAARKDPHSMSAKGLEDSAYLGFVKEQNIRKVVELFNTIKSKFPADNIELGIQVDPAHPSPDSNYRYTVKIEGKINGRDQFLIGYHINAKMAEEFMQTMNIPIDFTPYRHYPVDPYGNQLPDNRHRALRHYITSRSSGNKFNNTYYAMRQSVTENGYTRPSAFVNRFNTYSCNNGAYKSPTLYIDLTTAPHNFLDPIEAVREIPFAEFIGLMKNKDMQNFLRLESPTTRSADSEDNIVDFKSMGDAYFKDGRVSAKNALNKSKINRISNRNSIIQNLFMRGPVENVIPAYALIKNVNNQDMKEVRSKIRPGTPNFDFSQPVFVAVISGNHFPLKDPAGNPSDPIAIFPLTLMKPVQQTVSMGTKAVTSFSTQQVLPQSANDLVTALEALPFGKTYYGKPQKGAESYVVFQLKPGSSLPKAAANIFLNSPAQWPFMFYESDVEAVPVITEKDIYNKAFFPIPPRAMTLDGLRRKWGRANVKPSHPRHMIRLGGMVGYPNFLHQI